MHFHLIQVEIINNLMPIFRTTLRNFDVCIHTHLLKKLFICVLTWMRGFRERENFRTDSSPSCVLIAEIPPLDIWVRDGIHDRFCDIFPNQIFYLTALLCWTNTIPIHTHHNDITSYG